MIGGDLQGYIQPRMQHSWVKAPAGHFLIEQFRLMLKMEAYVCFVLPLAHAKDGSALDNKECLTLPSPKFPTFLGVGEERKKDGKRERKVFNITR